MTVVGHLAGAADRNAERLGRVNFGLRCPARGNIGTLRVQPISHQFARTRHLGEQFIHVPSKSNFAGAGRFEIKLCAAQLCRVEPHGAAEIYTGQSWAGYKNLDSFCWTKLFASMQTKRFSFGAVLDVLE